jgi:hypothetical protein
MAVDLGVCLMTIYRGDEVVITQRGVVQRVDLGTGFNQGFDPRPGKGILVGICGNILWLPPYALHVVKAAPRHKLKSGDRAVHKNTGKEFVRIGDQWMCTFDLRGREIAEKANTWDEMTIGEAPDEWEYYPRSEETA